MLAVANISANGLNDPMDLRGKFKQGFKHLPDNEFNQRFSEFDSKLNELKERQKKLLVEGYNTIIKKSAVSCWHKNRAESEAMWRIYSEKGIAIVSSLDAIKASMANNMQNVKIFGGSVKYLDYDDESIQPSDCKSDGHIMPLIKRIHYSHENEYRLFIAPKHISFDPMQIDELERQIDIDPIKLIERIIISPYVKEPFISSVIAICKLYNIPEEKISTSPLLESYGDAWKDMLDSLT